MIPEAAGPGLKSLSRTEAGRYPICRMKGVCALLGCTTYSQMINFLSIVLCTSSIPKNTNILCLPFIIALMRHFIVIYLVSSCELWNRPPVL